MSITLTATQDKVLAFVEQASALSGPPPTIKEIAQHFGWSSTSTAQQHLAALQKKGRLARTPKSPRSLRVTGPLRAFCPDGTIAVPLVGRIAAGSPIFALEDAEIEQVGTILDSMIVSRDRFKEAFENLANTIQILTKI